MSDRPPFPCTKAFHRMMIHRTPLASLLIAPLLLASGLAWSASAQAADDAKPPTAYRVYVGTYTGGNSEGIYQFKLNLADGALQPLGLAGATVNPSFLAIHPNGKFLYAVGEVSEFEGKKTGGVSAFALDNATGRLKLLNTESSGGAGPCHLTTDSAGKCVLTANYGGGSVAALPIKADGTLAPPSSFIQHTGSSADPSRQKGPHAHSVNLSPDGRFAFVADLGLDMVLIYKFDAATGKLEANNPPHIKLAPGAGPRHFAFHPSGKFAFVNNEMHSTVTAMSYDAQSGTLTELQTITTLPKGFAGNNSTAEVQVHSSGKYVYVSNRGHNSIACYTFNESTGKLKKNGHQGENVNVPRNFTIDPTGQFAVVANQQGNSLVVFRVDAANGKLVPTGQMEEVTAPVCVRFLAWE